MSQGRRPDQIAASERINALVVIAATVFALLGAIVVMVTK